MQGQLHFPLPGTHYLTQLVAVLLKRSYLRTFGGVLEKLQSNGRLKRELFGIGKIGNIRKQECREGRIKIPMYWKCRDMLSGVNMASLWTVRQSWDVCFIRELSPRHFLQSLEDVYCLPHEWYQSNGERRSFVCCQIIGDTRGCDSITGFVQCSMSIAASVTMVERSGFNDTAILRSDIHEVVIQYT